MTALAGIRNLPVARAVDVSRVPRHQRAAVGPGDGTARSRLQWGYGAAAAGHLHPGVHGRAGQVPGEVLPAVHARCAVRQDHGRLGLGPGDRAADRSLDRQEPGDPGHRAGVRPADLWRRVAVRGGVCRVPDRQVAVSRAGHPEAPDPGRDRAGLVHVHDDGAARHPGDPERDPDRVFSTRRRSPRRGSAPSAA